MNEGLGKIHFYGSFICMNGVFSPMFIQGLAGVSRRLYDGGTTYLHAQPVLQWNEFMTMSAIGLGLFQFFFIANLFISLAKGEKASSNPWDATTLEWAAAPSPPLPHVNFEKVPNVYHGPYEYSTNGNNNENRDFTPQHEAVKV